MCVHSICMQRSHTHKSCLASEYKDDRHQQLFSLSLSHFPLSLFSLYRPLDWILTQREKTKRDRSWHLTYLRFWGHPGDENSFLLSWCVCLKGPFGIFNLNLCKIPLNKTEGTEGQLKVKTGLQNVIIFHLLVRKMMLFYFFWIPAVQWILNVHINN